AVFTMDRCEPDCGDRLRTVLGIVRVQHQERQRMLLRSLGSVKRLQPLYPPKKLTPAAQGGRTVLLPAVDPTVEVVVGPGSRHLYGLRRLVAQRTVTELDLGEQRVLDSVAQRDQCIRDQ